MVDKIYVFKDDSTKPQKSIYYFIDIDMLLITRGYGTFIFANTSRRNIGVQLNLPCYTFGKNNGVKVKFAEGLTNGVHTHTFYLDMLDMSIYLLEKGKIPNKVMHASEYAQIDMAVWNRNLYKPEIRQKMLTDLNGMRAKALALGLVNNIATCVSRCMDIVQKYIENYGYETVLEEYCFIITRDLEFKVILDFDKYIGVNAGNIAAIVFSPSYPCITRYGLHLYELLLPINVRCMASNNFGNDCNIRRIGKPVKKVLGYFGNSVFKNAVTSEKLEVLDWNDYKDAHDWASERTLCIDKGMVNSYSYADSELRVANDVGKLIVKNLTKDMILITNNTLLLELRDCVNILELRTSAQSVVLRHSNVGTVGDAYAGMNADTLTIIADARSHLAESALAYCTQLQRVSLEGTDINITNQPTSDYLKHLFSYSMTKKSFVLELSKKYREDAFEFGKVFTKCHISLE